MHVAATIGKAVESKDRAVYSLNENDKLRDFFGCYDLPSIGFNE
jgi:hypothetical protein